MVLAMAVPESINRTEHTSKSPISSATVIAVRGSDTVASTMYEFKEVMAIR